MLVYQKNTQINGSPPKRKAARSNRAGDATENTEAFRVSVFFVVFSDFQNGSIYPV